MIELTRLNGHKVFINSDLIKYVEAAPDTLITLVTNEKAVVVETCEEVVQQALRYKQRLLAATWPTAADVPAAKVAHEITNPQR